MKSFKFILILVFEKIGGVNSTPPLPPHDARLNRLNYISFFIASLFNLCI